MRTLASASYVSRFKGHRHALGEPGTGQLPDPIPITVCTSHIGGYKTKSVMYTKQGLGMGWEACML